MSNIQYYTQLYKRDVARRAAASGDKAEAIEWLKSVALLRAERYVRDGHKWSDYVKQINADCQTSILTAIRELEEEMVQCDVCYTLLTDQQTTRLGVHVLCDRCLEQIELGV